MTKNLKSSGDEKTPGIDSTVGSFASRIRKQLQEQAEQSVESERATKTRHSLMMQAMTNIRRALSEACRIELGERFSFKLETGDWEGWPRVELRLVDSVSPKSLDHALVVTATDRRESGSIIIDTKDGKRLGHVGLLNPDEFPRVQVVLKRALRDFLDTVGAYILNPKKPSEMIEHQTKPIETGSFDVIGAKLENEELFSDEDNYSPNQNTVDLDDDGAPIADIAASNK